MDISPGCTSQIHIYVCKWAWCRSVFEDHPSLVHHVIHDHARRSIPVRRRDLSLIRRAEEGSGESLRISYLMSGTESSTQSSQKLASQSSQINPPTSSLPSPPNSSPENYSSISPVERRPGSMEPRSSSSSLVDRPSADHHAVDSADTFAQPATPDIILHPHLQAVESIPAFASLSSPAGSPTPLAVPNSPAFSSLVRPNKRKLVFDIPENATSPKLYESQSQSLSHSSTGSQMSVEMQLTQSLEEDGSDQDAIDKDESETPGFQVPRSDPGLEGPLALTPTPPFIQEDRLYKAELRWDSSHPEPSQENDSETESRESLQNDLGSWSQPPSQLKSFPIHYHRPKDSSPAIPHLTQLEFDSNTPLQLSSPVSLASPTFAVGTPQRQNWYQSAVVPKRSKKTDPEEPTKPSPSPKRSDASSSQPSGRRSRTPRSKPASKSKKFHSGTLQIMPAPSLPEAIPEESQTFETQLDQDQTMSQDIVGQEEENNSLQPDMDLDSQSTQDYSYPPLQTQAPYQSQDLSQF